MNVLLQAIVVRCKPIILINILWLLCGVLSAHALSPEHTPTCTPPGASASAPGKLTCSSTSLTLTGSSPAAGVTFTWSGPGGFSSMLQNPVISVPGTYNLTVSTVDGCTSAASVTVLQDIALPGAAASVSNVIDCATGNTTLLATTPTSGTTFRWIGNNFISTVQNPTVTEAGGYTLNVTNPVNGCTSTATVEVRKNVTLPGVAAFSSNTITCLVSDAQLSASSPTSGVTYSWTGPGGYTSSEDEPVVTAGGAYTVTALNPINSCRSTAVINVQEDVAKPGATFTISGDLTCAVLSATLSGSSNAIDVNYDWSGPGGFSSVVQNPVATVGGTYTLTVTKASNGCTSSYSADVMQNNTRPGAVATVSGELNCLVSQVNLQGSSSAASATYKWLGTGFSSDLKNAPTTAPGGYTLIVTDGVNGCTSTAVAIVKKNITPPANVTASVSGILTCNTGTVTLTASSTTSGVTYQWSGPGAITNPTSAVATVSQPGTYQVTVTNPANGCTTVMTVPVLQDIAVPAGVTASVSGILTCTTTSVTLTAASSTTGVTYQWSGPGTITNPTSATASVSTPGVYKVIVTNPVNGCASEATITVEQNIVVPAGVTASVSGILTCTTTSVTMTAASTTTGVTYSWSGPGTITNPTSATASVSTPGVYKVVVTNPVNGCKSEATITVEQNIVVPAGVTASVSGILTCTTTSVTLTAASSTTGVTYQWSGPGTITNPTTATASVSTPGVYKVVVTNPVNGCTSEATVTVEQNIVVPAGVTASVSGILTCTTTSVTLTAASSTTGVTYQWSGPGTITNPTSATASVSTPGIYKVVVTNPVNGCKSEATITVEQNIVVPAGVTASVSGILTCTTTSVTLTAASSTTGVTYQWSGPGTITNPTTATASVSTPGVYKVVVTNPVNGCTSEATVTVEQNIVVPAGVTASVSGILTCTTTSVTLTAASTTTGVTYQWSGPGTITNPTSATASVSAPGTYKVIVTNPVNGCTSEATVVVEQNIVQPGVTVSASGIFTCITTSITLSANSTVNGLTYQWSGPGGFSSTAQSPLITVSGTYTVVVTNPVNGCTSTGQITTQEDKTAPGVVASVASVLSCKNPQATITATSSTSGVLYSWVGPEGYISAEQTAVTTRPGRYTVTATNPTNGCTSTSWVDVLLDNSVPANVTATASGEINCYDGSVQLSGESATANVTYAWSGPNGYTSTEQEPVVDVPGVYHLTVMSTGSGCTTEASVTVIKNITPPQAVAASASSDLSCLIPSVTLTGTSTTTGVTYSWTGPNGFTSSSATPVVSVAGTYSLTVFDPVNGCSALATVTVRENKTTPANVTAHATGNITCTTPSVTLQGASSTPDVTYHWSGPAGYASNEQNPVTDIPGTYTLTVTHPLSGCTTSMTVTITANTAAPVNVSATVSGDITCLATSVKLTGSSTTSGVSYSWTGPGGFTSTVAEPTVSVAGTYHLKVTAPGSGCTVEADVAVNENKHVPADVTTTGGGVLTCSTTSLTLTGATTSSGVSYSWSGPSGFTATTATISVSVAGTYTLTVTDVVSGCSVTPPAITITEDKTVPNANISNTTSNTPILTCYVTPLIYTGTSTTSGATFSWSGPNGLVVNTAAISVTAPGTYTLSVTGLNGCVNSTRSKTVTQSLVAPTATVSVSGNITCANPSVTLTGSSSGSPVTYSWTGPSGFTSNVFNPSVSVAGTYTLTISTPGNCTDTKSITVVEDKTAPADVSASASGALNCAAASVTLTGSSTTANVTYHWSGPSGFTSDDRQPVTTLAGDYTLTVTNPASGCTATSNVTVAEDHTVPAGLTATVSGDITCAVSTVTLTGASTTSGVTYSWTGPSGFTATGATVSASASGTYTLTVTHPLSVCTASTTAVVNENKTVPNANISNTTSNTPILTCYVNPLIYTGTSTTTGSTFSWAGPNGLVVNTAAISVTAPGTYTLTVRGTNGCTNSTRNKVVTQSLVPPTATVSAGASITCANPSVTLTATSTGSPVTYSWSGPSGYTSTVQNPSVTLAGTYTLTISTVGGCTDSKSVTVLENRTKPENVTATVSGNYCTDGFATLVGASSTTNATYHWVGNTSGFVSDDKEPLTTLADTYTLTVTNPASGCTETRTVTLSCSGTLTAGRTASTASAEQSVTADISESSSEAFTVEVYPNPIRKTGVIRFTPNNNAYVVLEVYTLRNERVATLYAGDAQAGQDYNVTFDPADLASGVYIYRITYGEKHQQGRLVVVH